MAIDLNFLACKSWTDRAVTIDLATADESFIVLPIDLSGFKDFGLSLS
jgi:hypothetical protein